MSGIGFWELIILFLIGLIVLGPERLPRVANQLGSWLGQARRMTRVMKRQLEDELNFEKDFDIKPPSREPSKQPETVAPRDDDDYSPQHEADEPGSGVDDDELDASDDELVVKSAEQGEQSKNEDEAPADVASDPEKKETS
jgi:sec-independent protein translocase protein TatB